MLYICILEVLGSNLGRNSGYRGLKVSLFPSLGHDHFLPNPLPSIVNHCYPTLYILDNDSVVKYSHKTEIGADNCWLLMA
jgi:hypothetical protein